MERFTTRYLSPALVDSEFKQVSDYENKADNFSLKGKNHCETYYPFCEGFAQVTFFFLFLASKAANEVQAVYEKDELKLGSKKPKEINTYFFEKFGFFLRSNMRSYCESSTFVSASIGGTRLCKTSRVREPNTSWSDDVIITNRDVFLVLRRVCGESGFSR